MSVAVNNDAELVNGTLAGNRDAFSQIVSRYQSLVCSLAYSATGSLGQSEDLAQETFITAWKHLGHLRERDKLRSWLCGIARNRINNFLRREGREPIREAEPLENVSESRSPEPLPAEQTISNEEQAILWRSLVHIRIGDRFDVLRKPVTAWIAVGNYAVGGLFAFGGVAIAPFCIGGLTIGLLPFGGLALGIMPLGGLALGVLAFGGVVIGWQAIGGCAIAWKAAVGGVAIAHDFALGGIASAAQANNSLAEQFIKPNLFFRSVMAMNRHWVWMNFIWIVPLFIQWRVVARSRAAQK
ncbi:MAG: RNA polymerase sigma factor [Verrucomicrobiales bacterium]|nr:RNA polymerase sigma factor [Verrucomicrobiales bacterium]